MALAVEAALTAVELVDAGWSRLTRAKTKREHEEERAVLEDRAMLLEGELAKERVEMKKLQAAVEEYKQMLLRLHQERGLGLEALDLPAPTDEANMLQLMRKVEEKVNSPEFLDHLLAPPGAVVYRGDPGGAPGELGGVIATLEGEAGLETAVLPLSTSPAESGASSRPHSAPSSRVTSSGGHMEICVEEDEDAECWQWVTAREMRGGIRPTSEPCSGLDGEEDYELVEGDDVVDGISLVLARFIATHPDYKGLSAEDLQKAMCAGFKDLKGKGVFRALWDWSKFVYKASRWTAAAYNVYRHPLMVRAIMLALLSSTRMIFGFSFL